MSSNVSIHAVDAVNTLDNGKVKWIPVQSDPNGNLKVSVAGASTTGGTKVYLDSDLDETAVAVSNTVGQVYWIHAINLTASVIYFHLYNKTAATVSVGSDASQCMFPIPTQGDTNGAGFVLSIPNGIAFSTAIAAAATTTIGGSSGPASGCIVNIGYAN